MADLSTTFEIRFEPVLAPRLHRPSPNNIMRAYEAGWKWS
jgi:hypothetical protein